MAYGDAQKGRKVFIVVSFVVNICYNCIEMSDKVSAHLIVRGRVQGVFFRAFTREVAVSLGLRGWVRNLPDGTVEALFEGDRKDIEQAVARCYEGPPASHVTDIDIEWGAYRGEFESFTIKY